jgi:hypothetical protein
MLTKCQVSFPSWLDLAELRKLLTPKLVPFIYGGKVVGTCAGLQDCLRLHLQRLVQTGQANFLATEQSSLVCNVTIGVDGRGSEKVGRETLQWHVSCPIFSLPRFIARNRKWESRARTPSPACTS